MDSMEITPERRALFVRAYKESGGSWSHACRATAPGEPREGRPCRSTWTALKKRDPSFAEELDDARGALVGELECMVADHALHGTPEPIVFNGRVVGEKRTWDHAHVLALRILAKHDPSWRNKEGLEITSPQVDYAVALSDSELAELSSLPEFEKVLELMQRVADRRAEKEKSDG